MRLEHKTVAAHLQRRRSRKHEEELPGGTVDVMRFGGSGRHSLGDDTRLGTSRQMPAIAAGAPCVVFGHVPANRSRDAGTASSCRASRARSATPSRWMPSLIISVLAFEKLSRSVFAPEPSVWKGAPGTKATF